MKIYRGDIFFVKKGGYSSGSEQEQGRPAVVVSNDKANEYSPVVEVVYLTTQEKKPLPTHVEVLCRVPSIALCEQVHSVYVDRLEDYVKTCTAEEMKAIDRDLMISLGLTENMDCAIDSAATVENHLIDDLKMKLEGAERELDEAKDMYKHEKNICHALQIELDELKKQPIFSPDSDEVVRLKAQIEVLEKQNERLLDRLIG